MNALNVSVFPETPVAAAEAGMGPVETGSAQFSSLVVQAVLAQAASPVPVPPVSSPGKSKLAAAPEALLIGATETFVEMGDSAREVSADKDPDHRSQAAVGMEWMPYMPVDSRCLPSLPVPDSSGPAQERQGEGAADARTVTTEAVLRLPTAAQAFEDVLPEGQRSDLTGVDVISKPVVQPALNTPAARGERAAAAVKSGTLLAANSLPTKNIVGKQADSNVSLALLEGEPSSRPGEAEPVAFGGLHPVSKLPMQVDSELCLQDGVPASVAPQSPVPSGLAYRAVGSDSAEVPGGLFVSKPAVTSVPGVPLRQPGELELPAFGEPVSVAVQSAQVDMVSLPREGVAKSVSSQLPGVSAKASDLLEMVDEPVRSAAPETVFQHQNESEQAVAGERRSLIKPPQVVQLPGLQEDVLAPVALPPSASSVSAQGPELVELSVSTVKLVASELPTSVVPATVPNLESLSSSARLVFPLGQTMEPLKESPALVEQGISAAWMAEPARMASRLSMPEAVPVLQQPQERGSEAQVVVLGKKFLAADNDGLAVRIPPPAGLMEENKFVPQDFSKMVEISQKGASELSRPIAEAKAVEGSVKTAVASVDTLLEPVSKPVFSADVRMSVSRQNAVAIPVPQTAVDVVPVGGQVRGALLPVNGTFVASDVPDMSTGTKQDKTAAPGTTGLETNSVFAPEATSSTAARPVVRLTSLGKENFESKNLPLTQTATVFDREQFSAPAEVVMAAPASRLEQAVKNAVNELGSLQSRKKEAVSLVIQPDRDTRMLLQISVRDGAWHVAAVCEQGNVQQLQEQWQQLQRNLDGQGISLAPLEDRRVAPVNPSHSGLEGQLARGGGDGRQQERREAPTDVFTPAASEMDHEPRQHTRTKPSHQASHRLLEIWA